MEVASWRHLGNHKHCVRLYETFLEVDRAYFVMERCQCPVSHMLKIKPLDTVARTVKIFSHMLMGIEHVHSVHLVHRDVKQDNFLAGGPRGEIIKLCDFGLTTPMPNTGKLDGTHGTPAFMSPEMLLAQGYDEKTDIWSLGAMTYMILFGCWAYAPKAQHASEMKEAIRKGSPGPTYKFWGQCQTCVMPQLAVSCFELWLRNALERDPTIRPTAAELLWGVTNCLQKHEECNARRCKDSQKFRTSDSDVTTRDGSNADIASPKSGKSTLSFRSYTSIHPRTVVL